MIPAPAARIPFFSLPPESGERVVVVEPLSTPPPLSPSGKSEMALPGEEEEGKDDPMIVALGFNDSCASTTVTPVTVNKVDESTVIGTRASQPSTLST